MKQAILRILSADKFAAYCSRLMLKISLLSIDTLTGFWAGFLCYDVLSRAPALIDDVADGVKRKQELQRGISHKVPHDMSQNGKLWEREGRERKGWMWGHDVVNVWSWVFGAFLFSSCFDILFFFLYAYCRVSSVSLLFVSPIFLWFLVAFIDIRFMPIYGGTLRDPNRRRRLLFLGSRLGRGEESLGLFLLP